MSNGRQCSFPNVPGLRTIAHHRLPHVRRTWATLPEPVCTIAATLIQFIIRPAFGTKIARFRIDGYGKLMMTTLITILTGLAAGAAHVFAGPDHLAAVAPLAVDQRKTPVRTGFFWGIGHSGGVWILALAAIILRDALPLDWLSSWSERIVGIVLIAVGLWAIRKAMSVKIHSHVHEHDGVVHAHIHVHEEGVHKHEHGDHEHIAHKHEHRALGIGLLHGFAGTSHLIGVLPALALPTRWAAVIYVVAFGIGSIAGMTIFSWTVGRLAGRIGATNEKGSKYLFWGSGLAAIAVGCFWLTL